MCDWAWRYLVLGVVCSSLVGCGCGCLCGLMIGSFSLVIVLLDGLGV